jgi:hypothetical protein
MSRETRINLIVLGVLLVALAPGAVILFNKKYDPTARPMNQPDFVKRHLVFLDPTPAPASIRRMMPTVTAAWVNDLSRQRFGVGMMTLGPDHVGDDSTTDDGQPQPVMSEKRLAQVVTVREFADGIDVGLLVWNLPRGTKSAALRLEALVEGAPEAAASPTVEVTSSELLTIPAAIKRDLQLSGYPGPPQQALWAVARVSFPESQPAPAMLTLWISCDADGAIRSDVAHFPTSPAVGARSSSK